MTKKRILLGALLALLALLVALPLAMDRESRRLDDALRKQAPGQFVKLSMGQTHIRTWGKEGAPTLVLVHGFNGPMTTWDRLAPLLAKAGYRVLAYDLIGRGFSDRPVRPYRLALFVAQLKALLDAQKLHQPVGLIGSSFGCVVSTAFSLRHPKRVKQLILLGPAGFPAPSEKMKWLLKIPYVSDYLYRIIGDRMMEKATRKYYVHPEKYPEAHRDFRFQQSIHGFKQAALSTLRHVPLHHYEKGWKALGESKRDVLLIWGKRDVSFPYSNHTLAKKLIPQANIIPVAEAAHLPHYEKPRHVAGLLLTYLKALTPAASRPRPVR